MTMIQPFGDRLLVKVIIPEEKTASGLLVKPISKEQSNRGLVIAVGEGTTLEDGSIKPLSMKVGDEVLFQQGTGTSFHTETDMYKILQARDILGKFIEEENN